MWSTVPKRFSDCAETIFWPTRRSDVLVRYAQERNYDQRTTLPQNGLVIYGGTVALLGHRRVGSGPEVVMVMHEWLGDHANWEPVWSYLNIARFSYFFLDLRGYGWSKDIPGVYSVVEAVNDVLDVMDHNSCERFHVVGHSMSAMVAQKLMLSATNRVKSIVAICPVPASGFRADEDTLQILQAVIDDDKAAARAILARGGSRYGDTWVAHKLGIARRASNRSAMQGYLRMFTKTDFASEIHGAETPILAIVGKHDIPFYLEESVRTNFEKLYLNFSLVVCEGAGHYPMLETPVFLAAQMEQFMSKLSSDGLD